MNALAVVAVKEVPPKLYIGLGELALKLGVIASSNCIFVVLTWSVVLLGIIHNEDTIVSESLKRASVQFTE
jgi:hypothetical protein